MKRSETGWDRAMTQPTAILHPLREEEEKITAQMRWGITPTVEVTFPRGEGEERGKASPKSEGGFKWQVCTEALRAGPCHKHGHYDFGRGWGGGVGRTRDKDYW